jgi:rubredoxin
MYKCSVCGGLQRERIPQNRIVVGKREKTYYRGNTSEVIGKGWEIVKEEICCKKCSDEFEMAHAE